MIKSLKKINMKAAWLFVGPEIGLKKQKIETVKKEIAQKYGELECHRLYAYDSNVYDLVNLLQSISLFSAPIFVEYRNAELIKDKAEIEVLENWIKNAVPDRLSFLILETEEFSVNKKLEACFAADQKQIFWELFENKKQDWIRNFFAANKMSISTDAIEAILNLVENNTDALKNECRHLALFFDPGKHIEEEEITELLSHNKDEDVFSLFDSLTYNDYEKTCNIFNKLVLSKNFSPVPFILGLSYCFRRLADIQHFLQESGEAPSQNKLIRFGVSGKKAYAQTTRALQLWNEQELNDILLLLNNFDLTIRKSGTALQTPLLEVLLLKISKKMLSAVSYTM